MSNNCFKKSIVVQRLLALSLILVMLVLSGCSNETEKSNSSDSTSSSESLSNVSSEDVTESVASEYFDTDDATVEVNLNHKEGSVRTDASDVKRERYPANLAYGYKGYADEQADALREEILNTPNTLELRDSNGKKVYDIKGDIFYISPGGNNDNDGLSPETAIQTMDAIPGLGLKNGDAILFERDSLYRIYERFYLEPGVLYGSYGEGEKPLIVGSPKNYANENWKPAQKRNVWVSQYNYNMPVGGFFDQGKAVGYLKTGLRDLEKNTDFFFDEEYGTIYLYCDEGNPADVYNSIEFTQNVTDLWVPTGVNDVTVDNIAIRYATCGIGMNFMNDNIVVTNCEIGFVGGGGSDPTRLRAGNGVGTWIGGAGMRVNHNWIYQTFDSAISPQGNAGKAYYYDDMEYTDNLLEFNNCDIEWWDHGNDRDYDELTWSRFTSFKMENNIMRFTSLGWGTRADDGGIRGIEGIWYGKTEGNYLENVTFKNNIIDCPGREIFKFEVETQKQRNAMTFANNTYYVDNKYRSDDVRMVFGWTLYSEGVVKSYFGTDAASTKNAIHLVDPTAKVYWYNSK